MATFEQRESGYWQAKIRRKGWPTQSKTFRTKAEAQEWARSVETEMDRGAYQSTQDAERTTFSELLARFKSEFAPKHYRIRTDRKEAWRFQCDRLNEFFGPYSLVAIDQKLLTRYREERLSPTSASKRPPVSESTVRKEIYMFSKILGFAEAEGGIHLPRGNPVDKIRKPAEGIPRERRLSPDEWTRLETECKSSRNKLLYPALLVAVETAMRQGELLSIRWPDIDFQRRIAFLSMTKNGEARSVPLSSIAIQTIKSLPRDISGLVFPLQRLTLYHAFEAACKRAEIENFTWHDIRHESLSRLAERGNFSVLELAAVSGHKTLQMLKRYTHLQASSLALKLG